MNVYGMQKVRSLRQISFCQHVVRGHTVTKFTYAAACPQYGAAELNCRQLAGTLRHGAHHISLGSRLMDL
jgi:hypothetical protein